MNKTQFNLLLADNDLDDCTFFKEVLEELPFNTKLTTVNNGEQLMQLLTTQTEPLPHVLYMDYNMPRKNGYECLKEMKRDIKLKQVCVIILSTYIDNQIINQLYEDGAHYYIQKPAEFSNLKKVILKSLQLIASGNFKQPEKENFVINNT
jgi:CheY-like chemotaxis protein